MSGLKSFVVAGGTGGLGQFIVQSLLKEKATSFPDIAVYTLSRTADPSANPPKLGADYTNEESIVSALKSVNADVVISALTGHALAVEEKNLIKASKKAGAKLYVPTEFGSPTDESHGAPNIFGMKAGISDLGKEIGIPTLRIFTGAFADWVMNSPLFGLELSVPKVEILGDGTALASYTARPDIGSFTAHILVTQPLSSLENRIIRIEGDRLSFHELAAIFGEVTGKEVQVTYRDKDLTETRALLGKEGAFGEGGKNIVPFILEKFASGKSLVSADPSGLDNGLWKEWNPKSVKQVATEAYKSG